MTDAIYWDAEEELSILLEREPSYEEVMDFLNSKFKEARYDTTKSSNSKGSGV